jgi:hypothetical protein
MSINAIAVHLMDPHASLVGRGVWALPLRRRPNEHAVEPPWMGHPPPYRNAALP